MTNGSKNVAPLMLLAGLSLLAGLWAGALRLGWNVPIPIQGLPLAHGPLMVAGFLGTLIGLERAVALSRYWPYGVPVFTGLGALTVLAGLPNFMGASLTTMGSLFMVLVFIDLYRQSPAAHFLTMTLSAVTWLIGNILWLAGFPLFSVTCWWAGFLVLMIAGERLQLSRIMQRSKRTFALFHTSTALLLFGLIISLFSFYAGLRVAGAGLLALAVWLFLFDIARHTARESGLPRFMAICLLSGYLWLGVSGLLWILFAQHFQSGPRYDAILHTIFLGFVVSMIFAHAPVIFPSITGMALPFRGIFYLHLLLLHLSLGLRIAGDLMLWVGAYQWGGLLNIAAVLIFLVNNVRAVRSALRNHGESV